MKREAIHPIKLVAFMVTTQLICWKPLFKEIKEAPEQMPNCIVLRVFGVTSFLPLPGKSHLLPPLNSESAKLLQPVPKCHNLLF